MILECTRSTIIEFGLNDLNINCNSSKGSASWFNSSPSAGFPYLKICLYKFIYCMQQSI
nr:MAG TPA: hypothetical protein [Caudoviricetes sp.]